MLADCMDRVDLLGGAGAAGARHKWLYLLATGARPGACLLQRTSPTDGDLRQVRATRRPSVPLPYMPCDDDD